MKYDEPGFDVMLHLAWELSGPRYIGPLAHVPKWNGWLHGGSLHFLGDFGEWDLWLARRTEEPYAGYVLHAYNGTKELTIQPQYVRKGWLEFEEAARRAVSIGIMDAAIVGRDAAKSVEQIAAEEKAAAGKVK